MKSDSSSIVQSPGRPVIASIGRSEQTETARFLVRSCLPDRRRDRQAKAVLRFRSRHTSSTGALALAGSKAGDGWHGFGSGGRGLRRQIRDVEDVGNLVGIFRGAAPQSAPAPQACSAGSSSWSISWPMPLHRRAPFERVDAAGHRRHRRPLLGHEAVGHPGRIARRAHRLRQILPDTCPGRRSRPPRCRRAAGRRPRAAACAPPTSAASRAAL